MFALQHKAAQALARYPDWHLLHSGYIWQAQRGGAATSIHTTYQGLLEEIRRRGGRAEQRERRGAAPDDVFGEGLC